MGEVPVQNWPAPDKSGAAGSANSFAPHLFTRTPAPSALPVGLQLHRLDHRLLDPEHPTPYPARAHVFAVVVLTVEGQNLLRQASGVRRSTIFIGSHPPRFGALCTGSGRPRAWLVATCGTAPLGDGGVDWEEVL